jgi:hypothetical protein
MRVHTGCVPNGLPLEPNRARGALGLAHAVQVSAGGRISISQRLRGDDLHHVAKRGAGDRRQENDAPAEVRVRGVRTWPLRRC